MNITSTSRKSTTIRMEQSENIITPENMASPLASLVVLTRQVLT